MKSSNPYFGKEVSCIYNCLILKKNVKQIKTNASKFRVVLSGVIHRL